MVGTDEQLTQRNRGKCLLRLLRVLYERAWIISFAEDKVSGPGSSWMT